MAQPTQQPEPTPEPGSAAASRWRVLVMPGVVCGLLGGQMIFIAIAITLATGDRSFAVVPDYYQKAVDWDQRKADLAASDALGWSIEVRPGEAADALGQRQLAVVVRGREGLPIEGATVHVDFFHHARAKDNQSAELVELVPGQYAAQVKMPQDGRWQFDLEIERGSERFVATVQQHVSPAQGGE